MKPIHCLLTSARITRFIAAFVSSSPGFIDSLSSSSAPSAVFALDGVGVVVFCFRICARRRVDIRPTDGVVIGKPASFADGTAVVKPPGGRTDGSGLTLDAIQPINIFKF